MCRFIRFSASNDLTNQINHLLFYAFQMYTFRMTINFKLQFPQDLSLAFHHPPTQLAPAKLAYRTTSISRGARALAKTITTKNFSKGKKQSTHVYI